MADKAKTPENNDSGVETVTAPKGGNDSAPAPRRQLGAKEPIVFKWKLLGTAGDVVLTLFKSTEREEVDAQLERVQREGYYTNLQIVEADAKVAQPKKVRESFDKQRMQMGAVVEKKERETKSGKSRQPVSAPNLIRIGRAKTKKVPSTKTRKATRTAGPKKVVKKAKRAKKPVKAAKKKTTKTTKKAKKAVKKKTRSKSAAAKKKKKASPSSRKRRKR